jgi:hypothetical protein
MVGSGMTRRAMIGGALTVVAGMSMPFPAFAQGRQRADEAATRYGRRTAVQGSEAAQKLAWCA